jgi:hypothetical protein
MLKNSHSDGKGRYTRAVPAGRQEGGYPEVLERMDSRLHGNDEKTFKTLFQQPIRF